MKNLLTLLAAVILIGNTYAQAPSNGTATENTPGGEVTHRVNMGETVVMIAKKYLITPSEIYKANPDAVEGISPGMVLTIPLDKVVERKTEKEKESYYRKKIKRETKNNTEVASADIRPERDVKETSIDALQPDEVQNNDSDVFEVRDMRPDIPAIKTTVAVEKTLMTEEEVLTALPESGIIEVTHTVKSGETLTGLARKYNTTIPSIQKENSSKLKHGLQIGQELTIPAGPTPQTVEGVVIHNVKSGETLIGLARKYNTTIEDITLYNKRKLRHGLQIGQKLSIMPGDTVEETNEASVSVQ